MPVSEQEVEARGVFVQSILLANNLENLGGSWDEGGTVCLGSDGTAEHLNRTEQHNFNTSLLFSCLDFTI